MRDKAWPGRGDLIEVLGEIDSEQAIKPIVKALADGDSNVSWKAAVTLEAVGSPSNISAIWSQQLKAVSLCRGDNYCEVIEAIQKRCRFYNYDLYRQDSLPLRLPRPAVSIPSLRTSVVAASFTGASIGTVNIASVLDNRFSSSRSNHRFLGGEKMAQHNISFSGASIGGVNIDSMVSGDQIGTQHNYASEKDLAQASLEIQELLETLHQSYPNDVQAAVENQIRTNPHFRQRIHFVLRAGYIETLKAIFPPIGIPIEMIKAWIESAQTETSIKAPSKEAQESD